MIEALEAFASLAIYWAVIGLMMTGLYALIARDNLIKKIMGLSIFQSSAILFYITMAKVRGGTAPILIDDHGTGSTAADHGEALVGGSATEAAHDAVDVVASHAEVLYSNPLPHVLMLTAIVVGVATLALALAMVVRIQDSYGTVEEDELVQLDLRDGLSQALRGRSGDGAA